MTHNLYQAAGVDIGLAHQAKESIWSQARNTFGPGTLGDIGSFGGLFHLTGYQDPVLVSSTDGVGTKLKIASYMDRFDTIGVDLVNHCINDIFVMGARPLFFLDYIGTGNLIPKQIELFVTGMAKACQEADVALIGGETAQLAGIYQGNDFDLVGFIVGAVERDEIIDGSTIEEGHLLVGIPSSGLHTNGYSLVRRVLNIDDDPQVLDSIPNHDMPSEHLGDLLLAPHRSYYHVLKNHLPIIKGMAHITGGGLLDNVPRVLPKGLGARINADSWEIPPLFQYIQAQGNISWDEMYQVFNMGIGMVVICSEQDASQLLHHISEGWLIGEVVKNPGINLFNIGD